MTLPAGDPRTGRVERIIEVLRVLERDRKITKVRLFDLLGVTSQSSFKRVKAELTRAGLPLTYNRTDGHFHLPESASVARYGMDARARAQLAQVRTAVAALGGPAYEALEDVLAVLEARIALDDPQAAAVVTSRHPQPRADAAFWAAIDRALTAVREHRWLAFTYARTAGGKRDERTIQPYAVHAHDGRYYVWGILEGELVPKLFAIDRMESVTIENDTFTPDPGLSLDDALRFSFGTMVGDGPVQEVIVRVAPEAAAFVRCRRWPSEVQFALREDGSVALSFAVTRLEEIVAWVLSFGGVATIESPGPARDALRAAAQRVLEGCGAHPAS
ncbi:MAG: WYL domain-containing protein [Candidatus Velthaea sp.]